MKRLLIILGLLSCTTLTMAQSYVTGWSGYSAYGSPVTSSNLTGLTAGEMVIAYGYGYSGQKPTSVTNTTTGGIPAQTWTSCGIATIPCWYAVLTTGGYMGVKFTNSNSGDNYDLGVMVFSGPNTVGVVGTHAATTTSMSATTSGSVNAASGCGVALTANTAQTGTVTTFSAGNIGGSAATGSIAGYGYAFGEYQCGTSYSGTLTATATQTASLANTIDVLYLYYYAVPPTASTPSLNSSTADFLSSMPLVITSATSGATIIYTTDGTTPATSTGCTPSGTGTSLTNGGTVTISSTTTTVNAIACESGYTNSAVGTGGPYTVFSTLTPVASDNFSSYFNANLLNNPATSNSAGLFWQLPLDVWTTGSNWSFLAGDGLVVQPDTVRGGSDYWVVDSGAGATDTVIERTGEGYYQNHYSTVYVDELGPTSYVGPTVRCSGTHCYYLKVGSSSSPNVVVGDYDGSTFITSTDTNLASGTHSLTLAVVGCALYPFVDGITPTGMAVSYTVPSCATTGQPGIYGGAYTNSTSYNWSAGNIGGTSSGYTPPTVSYGTYTFPFNTSSFSLTNPWMKYNVGGVWTGTLGPVSVTINGSATYALGNNTSAGAQYEYRAPFTFNQWAAGEIAINAFDSNLGNYFVVLEHQNFIPQYASCTGGACYDPVALYFGMELLNPSHGCSSLKLEYCGTPFWHVTMVNPVNSGTTDAVTTLAGSSTALMKGDLVEVRMVNGWADGFCKQNSVAPPSWSAGMTMTAGTTWIEAGGMYWVASASGTAGSTIPTFPTSATWSTTTYTGTTVTDGSGTWMFWGDACPSQSVYTRILHGYTANFSPSLTTNLSQALGIGYPAMWGQATTSNMPFITNASAGSWGYGTGEPCATAGACVAPSSYVPGNLIP